MILKEDAQKNYDSIESDIKTLTEQIDEIRNFEETIRKRKASKT